MAEGGISIWQLLIVLVVVVFFVIYSRPAKKDKSSSTTPSKEDSWGSASPSKEKSASSASPSKEYESIEKSITQIKKIDLKHPIVLIVVAAVALVGLYYIMSPYQNCLRDEVRRAQCHLHTS